MIDSSVSFCDFSSLYLLVPGGIMWLFLVNDTFVLYLPILLNYYYFEIHSFLPSLVFYSAQCLPYIRDNIWHLFFGD